MNYHGNDYERDESIFEAKREKDIIKRHIKKTEKDEDSLSYKDIDEMEDMEDEDF